jgi:hypothetical protein
VQKLVATKEGIELWWTGQRVDGDDKLGGQIAVSSGDSTAATFEIAQQHSNALAPTPGARSAAGTDELALATRQGRQREPSLGKPLTSRACSGGGSEGT